MSDADASNSGGRKRKRTQESPATKKPRLDEGTSHPMRAKIRLQQLRASVFDDLEKQPNTYVYPPLEGENGQDIRLLFIDPGKNDDPIKCRLVPSALPKSKPSKTKSYPYTALSYYWGEGRPIHPITVTSYISPRKRMNAPPGIANSVFIWRKKKWRGSGEIYVRSNLHVALQRFRKKNKATVMWIDALCIDQDDKDERSAQVKQMHQLYIQATSVRVWLGDGSGTEGSSNTPRRCFKFLRKFLDLQKLDSVLDELETGESKIKDTARHVVQLMCNKWFSRRWVIQELALARKAEVVYGKHKMTWSDFSDAIAIFIKSQERIGTVLSKTIAGGASSIEELRPVEGIKNLGANALVDFINNLFRRTENGDIQQRMMTLESLVSNLLAFEATDPRDTIYSVLSLAKDTQNRSTESKGNAGQLSLDKRLLPAYKNCLLDVYTDFIDYCIDKSDSLDILLRHWASSEKKERPKTLLPGAKVVSQVKREELPSWVPLIQKSSFGTPSQRPQGRSNGDGFAGNSIRNSQRNYSATLNLPPAREFGRISYAADVHPRNKTKKYSGELFVRGLRVGKVKKTTPRSPQGMIFKESLELAGFDHEWWQIKRQWAKKKPRIPEGFWRTIVADRGPDGINPPSWYPRACLECLNNLRPTGDLRPDDVIGLDKASSLAKLFLERVKDVVWERSIVLIELNGESKKVTYGLLPKETKKGDVICVFFGCSVPVVLRKRGKGMATHFLMIGECFVYGIMDGEAVAGREWAHPYSDAERFQIK